MPVYPGALTSPLHSLTPVTSATGVRVKNLNRPKRLVARLSLAGVLRVQGQKDHTADKGREEQQTRRPDEGSAKNQRETAQNSRDHRSAEKQCPLAHAASLTGAAGAVIVDEVKSRGGATV